jgi:MtrB/PioB family decaheme-associated outer membrane protein
MIVRNTLRAALMASTCLLPLVAHAQEDFGVSEAAPAAKPQPVYTNEVDVGAQYQSKTDKDAFKFNQYIGETNKTTAIGGFSIRGRDPWDSGNTTFWDAQGESLGFQDRSASVKYGQQGTWSAKVFYDGIPYIQSDSFHTVFDTSGKGTLANGLTHAGTVAPVTPLQFPACTNGVAATSASCIPAPLATPASEALWPSIAGQLSIQEVKTQRDRVGGDFNFTSGNWTFNGNLTHEHKEGTKENSLVFNSTSAIEPNNASTTFTAGGRTFYAPLLTTSMMYFPEPVNYDTDRYSTSAAFNTKKLQASFTYTFNKFTDNQATFNAQDPFQTILGGLGSPGTINASFSGTPSFLNSSLVIPGGNPAGTGAYFFPLTAAYSLPPSNSAHQFKFQLGYNLPYNTRVTSTVQYGLMYQDAAFPPPSNNLNQTNVPASLYGSSFNGFQQNIFGRVQVTSRPLPRLNVLASYTFDQRDDQSPIKNLAFIDGTTAAAHGPYVTDGTLTDNAIVTKNAPYSFTRQVARVEAGYSILPETKLSIGDTYSIKDSKFLSVDKNTENAVSARLNSQMLENVTGALNYTHSVRTASLGNIEAAWLSLNNFGQTQPEFNFLPYSEAPRTRDEIRQSLDWMPINTLGLDLTTSFANDHYPSYVFGMKSDRQLEVDPSVTFRPNKDVSYNLFYSFEQIYQGARFSTNDAFPNGTANSSIPWSSKTTANVHTVGASADWRLAEKLKVGALYNFSYGATQYQTFDGYMGIPFSNNPSNINFANLAPLPDSKNTLSTVQVHGEYAFTPSMSLWAGYTFQKLDSNDWTYGQAAVSPQYYNFVLTGDVNPSYSVHVVSAALRVKW